MKLYVWRLALAECRPGLAVAMAENVQAAKQALIRRGLPEHYFMGIGIQTEDDIIYPTEHKIEHGEFIFGG